MELEEFYYYHPVFRHEEFAALKAAQGTVKAGSVNSALQYYAKTGKLIPIRRKLYGVLYPGVTADKPFIDPYLLAAKVTDDAVIGYHSALELKGLAYSVFNKFTFLTEQKCKAFEFDEYWYQPVAPALALQRKKLSHVYVDTINRMGLDIRVTNDARTFVDVIDRVDLTGGWEEVHRAVSKMVVLKIDQVIDYCLMLDNARLNAKVGYFLSLRSGGWSVPEKQLEPLMNALPKVPQYAYRRAREKFQLVRPWNIYLPISVINRSWLEPGHDF